LEHTGRAPERGALRKGGFRKSSQGLELMSTKKAGPQPQERGPEKLFGQRGEQIFWGHQESRREGQGGIRTGLRQAGGRSNWEEKGKLEKEKGNGGPLL